MEELPLQVKAMRAVVPAACLCALLAAASALGQGTSNILAREWWPEADTTVSTDPLVPDPLADGEPAERVWGGVDYRVWWIKPVCLKPAVLAVGDPADPVPGAVGQPGTRVIMGEHRFEFGGASGVSPRLGIWLTPEQSLAFEASGFVLEQVAAALAFDSRNGSPATFITFLDPTNQPAAVPFSVPGFIEGRSVAVGSSKLWGAEANLSAPLQVQCGRLALTGGLVGGFRYLNLKDQVQVTNFRGVVDRPELFALGEDVFTTRNEFYGGQLGCRFGLRGKRFDLDYLTKLAVGIVHQVSEVSGSPQSINTAGSPLLLPGPFLALPSNTGRLTGNRFALVPEVAIRGRYHVTDHWTLSLGYSVLFWSNILCPGDQMDPHVNTTQLPFNGPFRGPAVPARMVVPTNFFAHGLDVGMELRF